MRRIVKDKKKDGTPLEYHMRKIGFLKEEAQWWSQELYNVFVTKNNKQKKSCELSITKEKEFLAKFVSKQLQLE